MQQSSATQSLHLGFWGLWTIVFCILSLLLAVPSCIYSFGTVSSLHPFIPVVHSSSTVIDCVFEFTCYKVEIQPMSTELPK